MGNCLISEEPGSSFTISEKKLNDNKIYKAYKAIKELSDDIQSKNLLKTDKIYLIDSYSIQDFVNFIERFSNLSNSMLLKLLEENNFEFNFDNLELINETNCETKNKFIIVDEKFFQILGIQENKNSVILDINKRKKINQIEFSDETKKGFIKPDNLNFNYIFDINTAANNLENKKEMNNSVTSVEKNYFENENNDNNNTKNNINNNTNNINNNTNNINNINNNINNNRATNYLNPINKIVSNINYNQSNI